MAITIRAAAAPDIPGVVAAYRASRQEAFEHLVPPAAVLPRTAPEDRRRWSEFAASGTGHLLVADTGAEIAGMAALEYEAPAAEVGALYVHPDHYRSGAGTRLLAAALGAARADGHAEVVAWVLASNQRAKAFFLGRGGWLDGGVEIRPAGSSGKLTMQRIRFSARRQAQGADGP